MGGKQWLFLLLLPWLEGEKADYFHALESEQAQDSSSHHKNVAVRGRLTLTLCLPVQVFAIISAHCAGQMMVVGVGSILSLWVPGMKLKLSGLWSHLVSL